MKKDQIVIYVLVGVMVFSAVATGLLFLTQSDPNEPAATSPADINNEIREADMDRFLPDGDVTELATTDLTTGSGAEASASSVVTVHYTGWLATTGAVFDSSLEAGQPATFPLSGVIQGWQEGIPGMRVGGQRRLVIPSELAYGSSGAPGGGIPPNADLVFEVELIDVQ